MRNSNFSNLQTNAVTIASVLATFALPMFVGLSIAHGRARGGEGVGGGDQCENRIKVIRNDLRRWLQTSEPASLEFPQGVSLEMYKSAMLEEIDMAKILCVGPGDKAHPVLVDGVPKTCRFDKSSASSTITCDSAKLLALSEEGQYGQTHHEYAGLAGIEIPNGADSNYDLSNQISYSLEIVSVKRLGRVKAPTITDFRELRKEELVRVGDRLLKILDATTYRDCTWAADPLAEPNPSKSQRRTVTQKSDPKRQSYGYFPARGDLYGYPDRPGDHLYVRSSPAPIVRGLSLQNFATWLPSGPVNGTFEAIYYFDPSGAKIVKVSFEHSADVAYPVGSVLDPGTQVRNQILNRFECHAI